MINVARPTPENRSLDGPVRIAYLTSHYARASDSFIRGEVQQLRELGCEVFTFSIRRPSETDVVSDEIRRERENTDDILCNSPIKLLIAVGAQLLTAPVKALSALALAFRTRPPGLKPILLAVAYWVEACYLARQLRHNGIQHLHNHIGESSASATMLAGAISGIPYSLTIHGPNEFDKATILALDEKVARSAFTVVISRFGRSQLLRWCRWADWEKVKIVRCGVDRSFLDAQPGPVLDSPRLLSVGRLAEQKGQTLLVEAAAELVDRGVELDLVIVGDGPMRDQLQEAIDRFQIGHAVRLVGWKSAAEIRKLLAESRGFVLPSFAEGLPVVLMEAMALGRPVIATAIAGIPELVRDGENGWLIPAGDRHAIADAMESLLQASLEDLEDLGTAARLAVQTQHNARIEAARLLDLIAPNANSSRAAEDLTNEPSTTPVSTRHKGPVTVP